jgi:hypothetical protein
MTQVLSPPPQADEENELDSMKTTSVDQVASFLLSTAIMIGLAVLLLGALFFLRNIREEAVPITIEEENFGRGENAAGFERDLEPPSADEVEQLNEPNVEQSLQNITEALTNISATLDTMAATHGKGDSRPAGPEGEGGDMIPRYERWELRFTARDSKGYAEQLDFFNIELGAIGGGVAHVDYLGKLVAGQVKRQGKGEDEKRLYFVNRKDGPITKYERSFMDKAGIATTGRQILKLVPKVLEDELAVLEKQYGIKERGPQVSAKDFAKTIFECQPGETKGFRWVVVEQRYRTAKK